MLIGVNKPRGMTSHDVVDLIRRITGERKVGHGGTLDPMASGVLVIGIGREATRCLGGVLKMDKEYIATIRLDGCSDTDDMEGVIETVDVDRQPSRFELDEAIDKFVGKILQTPPKYSAVKLAGKPAYKYARAGKDIILKPRAVLIKDINVEEYAWPRLRLRVITGSGVYIRSLARDIGEELNTSGYLVELIRTRVGKYTIKKALSLSELDEL